MEQRAEIALPDPATRAALATIEKHCANDGPFYATCNFAVVMGQVETLVQLSCTNWAEITYVEGAIPFGTGTVTLYTGPQGGTSTWTGVTGVKWLGDCLQDGLYE